jgi:benzoate membrane transport protein
MPHRAPIPGPNAGEKGACHRVRRRLEDKLEGLERAPSRLRRQVLFRDMNLAALTAGLTAFMWYAFGAVPLHLGVSDELALNPAQTSSWIFIVWFSGALSSILLTLRYRQPIPITWSIPGLVYLGTLAGEYSFAELVGANLVAGLLILGLGLLGVGRRIMAWLPLPIVLGMFAGSILEYVVRLVEVTVDDTLVAGSAIAGFVVGRALANPRIPPVGLAVVCGGLAVFLADRATPAPVTWALPTVQTPEMTVTLSAVVAVSLPLAVLAIGLGNVQGMGFLVAQGYRVPINAITVVVGVNSVINAFFGGHQAIVARTGVAILAARDAGPMSQRYWANLIAATLTFLLALSAATVASLLQVLPATFIVALAGLAIFTALQDAVEKAFGGRLRFGAMVAFVVAATPFAFAGITSDFWAIVAGLLASMLVERHEITAEWREGRAEVAG